MQKKWACCAETVWFLEWAQTIHQSRLVQSFHCFLNACLGTFPVLLKRKWESLKNVFVADKRELIQKSTFTPPFCIFYFCVCIWVDALIQQVLLWIILVNCIWISWTSTALCMSCWEALRWFNHLISQRKLRHNLQPLSRCEYKNKPWCINIEPPLPQLTGRCLLSCFVATSCGFLGG